MIAFRSPNRSRSTESSLLRLLIFLLSPSPTPPVSSLGSDSPPAHPPTSASPSPYLVHGHLADMEARRLEASPTIIISVCQACATLPACQAWERACPLSHSLTVCVCACVCTCLEQAWDCIKFELMFWRIWSSAPERTGNSYVRETWQIPRHCSPRYLAKQDTLMQEHTHQTGVIFFSALKHKDKLAQEFFSSIFRQKLPATCL